MNSRTARKRALRAGAAVVALAATLGACGRGGGGDAPTNEVRGLKTSTTEQLGDPVDGGELTVALEAESASWLPGESQLTTSFRNVAFAVYDPLVVVGDDGEHHPFLAESVTHDDALMEWTVKLRPGVRFHDGTELDASVMKTIFDDFLMAPSSTALGIVDEVESLRVDDDFTFTYLLSRPNGAFDSLLSGPIGWPFSPTAARAAGATPASRFVGTGPFRIESWQPNDRLVVARNDDYWRPDLPHLERITFRPVPDEQLRVDSLLTGAVDAIQSLRGHTIKAVIAAEDRGFTAHTHAGDDANVAVMNVLRPPFDDLRVRRAFAHLYDPAQLARIMGDDGLVERSTQFFGADSAWHSQRVAAAQTRFDIDAARSLVGEYTNDPARSDGLPVGTPPQLTFMCLDEPALLELAEAIRQQAGRAGFSVETQNVDTATLVTNLRGAPDADPPFGGDFSLGCFRSQATGDPAVTFGSWFGAPDQEASNLSNFTSPELVALINELRRTVGYNERYAIVEQIGILINEQVPVAFVSGTPAMIGVQDEVKNVAGWTTPEGALGEGVPYGVTHWGEVWVER